MYTHRGLYVGMVLKLLTSYSHGDILPVNVNMSFGKPPCKHLRPFSPNASA